MYKRQSYNILGGYSGYMAGGPVPGLFEDPNCEVYRFTGTSLEDPSSFEFSNEPLLSAGPQPYDQAGMASVAVVEWAQDEWYMFYVGFNHWVEAGNNVIQSSQHTLNMATSSDGAQWKKAPENPLPVNNISPGVVSDVAAQKYGSRILMWITDYYEEIDQSAVGFYVFEPDIEPHP